MSVLPGFTQHRDTEEIRDGEDRDEDQGDALEVHLVAIVFAQLQSGRYRSATQPDTA